MSLFGGFSCSLNRFEELLLRSVAGDHHLLICSLDRHDINVLHYLFIEYKSIYWINFKNRMGFISTKK